MNIVPSTAISDDILETINGIRLLGARPEGCKLTNGYNMGALDNDELALVVIARKRMSNYIAFVENPNTPLSDQQYFTGAAAAINDFMCSIGYGDSVLDLLDHLNR